MVVLSDDKDGEWTSIGKRDKKGLRADQEEGRRCGLEWTRGQK